MAFKIKATLTPRQLRRAKYTTCFATFILVCLGIMAQFSEAADDDKPMIRWNSDDWYTMDIQTFERGRIVYFSKNTEVCRSSIQLPGLATLNVGLLAIAYGLCLIYLFLGIAIVSEIFMSSIEKITAKKVEVKIVDAQTGNETTKYVLWWNATIANLTLMALGSSAPEILLAVIETVANLGACPGELGASTIVGSAAFNLLVITGLSIYAVSEETDTDEDRDKDVPVGIKRIYDMRVFAVTCTSSIWAYVWLWIVLLDQKVKIWEGVLTFVFFFLLIGFAYGADQVTKNVDEQAEGKPKKKETFIEFSAHEIYKELLQEKSGEAPTDAAATQRRDKMKTYLKETMNTDQVDQFTFDELKKVVEGDGLISRLKYRKQVGTIKSSKRPAIEKYQKLKLEHAHADALDDTQKNPDFGFTCLHYSVSESSEKLTINIINKKGVAGSIRVKTIDGDAKDGEDYIGIDQVVEFAHGVQNMTVDVGIMDDDNWEPDEDFFVQLYNPDTGEELHGQDTKTRVTIIDDDKPGQICFQETKGNITVSPTSEFCTITVIRKNGSDGKVTVDYQTVQLSEQDHVAQENVHYVPQKGQLVFEHNNVEQQVKIQILKPPKEENEEEDEDSVQAFGFQLSNPFPAGAKLSKKCFQIINIVTDQEAKKKNEAMAKLIAKLDAEEEQTWASQFITATMLHPTKDDNGDFQDIEAFDALFHFMTIGWGVFFAFIPPAHYYGGYPCFVISLAFIGLVTFVVGEYANLFGCVLGIKPSITAITFVALGTSLPDTFASMQAAQEDKYADAAIGNVTGSNSVNVFLGLGLPWVVATIYESAVHGDDYFVPAGSLGFSVVVFIICASVCVVTLLFRRWKFQGELGGERNARIISCVFLVFLWLLYILMSILQAYNVGGKENWEGMTFGIEAGVGCPARYKK